MGTRLSGSAWLLAWLVLGSLSCPTSAGAAALQWERVAMDTNDLRFVTVTVDPTAPERLFAATEHSLYQSADDGRAWTHRFRVPSEARIVRIAVSPFEPRTVLLGTTSGLYRSMDGGDHWSRRVRGIGPDAVCTQVAFHPDQPGRAYLASHGGLLVSDDQGRTWRDAGIPTSARPVVQVAPHPVDPDRLILITATHLFSGHLRTGHWQQRYATLRAEESDVEQPDVEPSETEEAPGSLHLLSAVAIDPTEPATVYLATSDGLMVSHDEGASWRQVTRTGLRSPHLSRLLLKASSPLVVYAATSSGITRYLPTEDRWETLTTGLLDPQVRDLAASPTSLWAATDQGLYRASLSPDPLAAGPGPSAHELLANFAHEPTMDDVRDAAIRYAEVHPDKIRRWRRQASLQGLLPTLSFDLDRDKKLSITSRGSTSDPATDRFLTMEDPSRSVDVSLAWDFGKLIWNDDQTSIDVRSKLMVQLRDDIIDEVTRTYYERRRLQIALLLNPPTDEPAQLESELRLQELTALLDGFTGGDFSRQTAIPDNL